MLIGMATANFYEIPFFQALRIIKRAGYDWIELDGYWQGGDNWETAQHIKNVKPGDVVQMVLDSGLRIASFHDMGGVIEQGADSIIARSTYEYLERYDFPCIILHTPCIRNEKAGRWSDLRKSIRRELDSIGKGRLICIENMKSFDGYFVPVQTPPEMLEFSEETNTCITIDTTHFAQSNIDLVDAAAMLKHRVRTIHLSDYHNGRSHVFVGDGDLDLKTFYRQLNPRDLYMTTIECGIPHIAEDEALSVESCIRLRKRVESLCQNN